MAKGVMRSNKTRDGIAAILADNLGQVEEDVYEVKQKWEQQHSKFCEMETAMKQGGLRVLNKPNMLKQNYWTYMSARSWTEDGQTYTLPAGDYIYGDAARVTGPGPYMKSVRSAHGQDTDEITETLQTLSGDDIITEMDGESYTRPIAFTVTNPPEQGWGNADQLIFNHGWGSNGDQGLLDLEDGKEYTMCCWAKVTGGTKMRIRFGWGENRNGFAHSPSKEELGAMTYKWIEISNTVWERISWRFTYHASQTWQETYYRNIAEEGQDPIWEPFQVTYTENYQPRVSFGVCRKYAGTVLLCGFRLVKGRLWISETYDGLEDGINANASAIENLKDADGDIMANLAEAEEVTAKVNHAAGEVFVIGNKMYRATAAIATGETITPGTNCETTTVEELIAAAVAGIDLSSVPGNLTLGGKFIIGGSEYSGIKLLNMFNVVKKTMSNSLLGTTWQFVEAPDYTSLSSITAAMMNNTADTMATCATAGVDMYGIRIMPAVSNLAIQYVTTSGTINAYDTGSYGWQHSSLRTIEFVAEPDTMPDEFLSWLLDNAILIS